MGWLIALGLLVLLATLPLGVRVRYDADGPLVRLLAGPVRLTLYPRKVAAKKEKPQKEEKARQKVRQAGPNQEIRRSVSRQRNGKAGIRP